MLDFGHAIDIATSQTFELYAALYPALTDLNAFAGKFFTSPIQEKLEDELYSNDDADDDDEWYDDDYWDTDELGIDAEDLYDATTGI